MRCRTSPSLIRAVSSGVSLHTLSSTLEQRIECAPKPEASAPLPARSEPSVAAERAAASDAAAVEGIDLAKIGSILNSLSSVMSKNKSAAPITRPLLVELEGNGFSFLFVGKVRRFFYFASFRSRSGESSCHCPI